MYYLEPLLEKDFVAAVGVWESSVRATHDFLGEEDILGFRALLPSYLAKAATLVGMYEADTEELIGFAGVSLESGNLDMLFLRGDKLGQGLGEVLLRWALRHEEVQRVDVNEQNGRARRFYERHGFVVRSRSERDGQGNAFPILHLEYEGGEKG